MLTWGPNPSDLDSMVRFFDENGNEVCKLYYSNKNCEDYATLDVDEKEKLTSQFKALRCGNSRDKTVCCGQKELENSGNYGM